MAGLEGFYHGGAPGTRREAHFRSAPGPQGSSPSPWSPEAPPQYVEAPHPHLQFPQENPPGFVAGRKAVAPREVSTPASSSSSPVSDRYAGLSFGVTGLVSEYFVSHPFVVVRRQCQVNNASLRHHRAPFTLVPVVANLNRSQGLGCLWKGLGSSLTVRGLTLAAEDLASKFTPWPKEVDRRSSLRMVGQHLLLKAVSLAAVTPFYSASLVETVQSEIASEKPGVLDVFREGVSRILNWSCPHSGRMLPVWLLVPPTVAHGVMHYAAYVVTSSLSHTLILKTYRERQRAKGAVTKVQYYYYYYYHHHHHHYTAY